MEDEIDLREYVRALIRRWRLIVALTVLGALVAGSVSLLLPPVYEATALVSVSPSRYSLRLEGVTQNTVLPLKAYPDLALSDEILGQVFTQVRADLPAKLNTLSNFRETVMASAGADPTLLKLTVQGNDPEIAARVANLWARIFTEQAGRLYAQDAANLTAYEAQVDNLKNGLLQAEETLAIFQAGNQTGLRQAQLDSQQAILTDYLNRAHQFNLLVQNAQDLRERLGRLELTQLADPADDVAVLLLTAQATAGSITQPSGQNQSQVSAPAQIQIVAGPAATGKTVGEQIAAVDNLIATLQTRAAAADAEVTALEPRLLDLQGQVAQAKRQESSLTLARDLIRGQYLALAAKLQEARIAAQESANMVQLASEAALPTEQTSPRPVLNLALGVAVGGVLGALWAWLTVWWQAPAASPQKEGAYA